MIDSYDKLAAFVVPEIEALRLFGERQRPALDRVLTNGHLEIGESDWLILVEAISETFGLGLKSHCFGVIPYRWARFHEPQITRGLEHFVEACPTSIRAARALAILKSVEAASPSIESSAIEHAEAQAEGGRMDLTIVAKLRDGTSIGTVVEAKFGHHLTTGQLPTYKLRSAKLADQLTRVVIAPHLSRALKTGLRRNRTWGFFTWSDFLQRLERHLPETADDLDFRRFRRTIWLQAYGV